jgi:hypothetical protein
MKKTGTLARLNNWITIPDISSTYNPLEVELIQIKREIWPETKYLNHRFQARPKPIIFIMCRKRVAVYEGYFSWGARAGIPFPSLGLPKL